MAHGSSAPTITPADHAPTAAIEALHAAQQRLFASGKTLSRSFRTDRLRALHAAVARHERALLDALHADLGRSEVEGYWTEVGFVLADITHALRNLGAWMRRRTSWAPLVVAPSRSYIQAQPLGLNLIIGAWNYPVNLTLSPLVGAIAAGNVAIVKPSELAPASSEAVANLVAETFDEAHVAVVEGDLHVAQRLLAQRWDHIFFTGSTRVGKVVAHAAADHLARCTLELGGKSPVIVTESADLDVAAKRIVWGKLVNAGQTCVAPDYMLVHESVHDALLQRMTMAVREFYGANPRNSRDYARIVNEQHFDRLCSLIDDEKVVLGGETDRRERYIAPTFMDGVTMDDAVMAEEIFGPLLPIMPVASLEQAIERVSQRPNPLALYLFSTDPEEEDHVVERVSFGGGCINNTLAHLGDPKLPFGGIGASGTGAYHGEHSFVTFSHMKGILKTGNFLDPSVKYPPYTPTKMSIFRKMFR
jgi:aldehyde dehydrogenase (NAD+)